MNDGRQRAQIRPAFACATHQAGAATSSVVLTQHLFETGPSDGVTASGVTEQVPPTVDAAIVPVGGDRERGGAGTCGEYDSCVLGQRADMGQHGVTRHQHGRAGVLALQPVQQFDTPVWRTRHAGKTDSDSADITERARVCNRSRASFVLATAWSTPSGSATPTAPGPSAIPT